MNSSKQMIREKNKSMSVGLKISRNQNIKNQNTQSKDKIRQTAVVKELCLKPILQIQAQTKKQKCSKSKRWINNKMKDFRMQNLKKVKGLKKFGSNIKNDEKYN